MNDDQLDDLLNTPLAAVADDGFTPSLMRHMQAHHRRMQLLRWGLMLACLLPLLIALPLADWSARLAHGIARGAPIISYIAAALVLLWVWKPRFFTQ